jgi:hypothetical protein
MSDTTTRSEQRIIARSFEPLAHRVHTVAKAAIFNNADFTYFAELRKLDRPANAVSFTIRSAWQGAKNATEEQTVVQITLDSQGLAALRDLIDEMVQS